MHTYQDLMNLLVNGDKSSQTITVYNPNTDEYYSATIHITTETDVLDKGHIYLSINN
jgi:uncharacterized protein (DUF2147 family)